MEEGDRQNDEKLFYLGGFWSLTSIRRFGHLRVWFRQPSTFLFVWSSSSLQYGRQLGRDCEGGCWWCIQGYMEDYCQGEGLLPKPRQQKRRKQRRQPQHKKYAPAQPQPAPAAGDYGGGDSGGALAEVDPFLQTKSLIYVGNDPREAGHRHRARRRKHRLGGPVPRAGRISAVRAVRQKATPLSC